MRLRSLAFVLLGIVGVLGLLRRRRPSEFVDVQFVDGSVIRLTGGAEARDLLDDAYAILDLTA